MKKDELALQLARATGIPAAEAADRVDDVVHGILKKLRQGKPASLPGLGKLTPEPAQKVRYTGQKAPQAPKAPPKGKR
jgi:nucleoid DNA-binding protein